MEDLIAGKMKYGFLGEDIMMGLNGQKKIEAGAN